MRRKVKVAYLQAYRTEEAVELEMRALRQALEREMPGCEVELLKIEPSFEEPVTGEFYWLAPHARQAAETKKRYRKQILAGVVTVLRAVGRTLPDFLVGSQQGALIAVLMSNPLVLEVATRQRVATDSELEQLRAGWPRVRGILGIQPFATVAHSTMERLMEALPEVSGSRRILTCAITSGPTASERRFVEGLVECLGARHLTADLAGLGWGLLLDEPILILPWQHEGCVSCGKKAQLTRCQSCCRPLHLTCAVNRKKPAEPPICLHCYAATQELVPENTDRSAVCLHQRGRSSEEIFRAECAHLASLPPAVAARAMAEAEWAEECMKDKIPAPARKELDRELGHSRNFMFENFVPTTLRQKAVQASFEKIIDEWSEVPAQTVPLPVSPEMVGLRDCLKSAQMGEDYAYERMNYLAKDDKAREDATRLNRSEAARLKDLTRRLRLNPEDGVLESSTENGYVPYIPAGLFPFKSGVTWRRWLFEQVHDSPIRGHRDAARTVAILRKMAYWPGMSKDADHWCSTCSACAKVRGQPMPQLQGTSPEETYKGSWLDIYVDFQGPFPESYDGFRYLCTYTCSLLRVPMLVPCATLTKDDALHAVVTALLRSLTIPEVIRHDRGPEFANALMEEICGILGIDSRVPSPHRPQEVGQGETIHREINKQTALLMGVLTNAYPQEWTKGLDLVFYILMTSPLQESGYCARDLDRCWSQRDHLERELVRLDVGPLLTTSQYSDHFFERYRLMRSAVTRYFHAAAVDRAVAYDRGLHPKELRVGDKVCRKESRGVLSKQVPRNSGPYIVHQVLSNHKVTLAKLDGELAFTHPVPVSELVYIPERVGRPIVDLGAPSASRSLGSMLKDKDPAPPLGPGVKAKLAAIGPAAYVAYKPPVAENPKSVIVGRVIENKVAEAMMKIQRYNGRWHLSRVQWTRSEEVDVVRYSQVIREVTLHRDGGVTYSDLRALDHGNWQMQVARQELVACVEEDAFFDGMKAILEAPDCFEFSRTPPESCKHDQVYVCQPDHRIVNDAGRESHLLKPVAVQNQSRWKDAMRACFELLRPKLKLSGPGSYIRFDPGERRVSAFQRMIKGLNLMGVVCFVPPVAPKPGLQPWLCDILGPSELVVLATYAAGSAAVYSARSWEEMGPLCAELPHGEFYVALPCRPSKGSVEASYQLTEEVTARPVLRLRAMDYDFDPDDGDPPPPLVDESDDEDAPAVAAARDDSDSEDETVEVRQAAFRREGCFVAAEPAARETIPHVKRWEGEPVPSVQVADEWRARAKAGNFSEVKIPLECYVGGVTSCPRSSKEYSEACLLDMHLPLAEAEITDEHRKAFPDLQDIEIRAVSDLIFRKAAVMWREGTPQTTVVGFLHDMVVKGGPISLPPICRRGEAADWVEEKIRKDYARGQLVPGSSPWGSPAFRVSAKGRKDRMVVDYRRVNALTERATFLMPSADGVKTRVAGSRWFSTADGVAGFNQIKNTPYASQVLAIVSMSGKHLPTSLVFGPRNGPEDFSKFGYRIFRRKLFRTWFLFVDDVCVATGKGRNNEAAPGEELERLLAALPTAEERKALIGLGKAYSSDPTPNAHWNSVGVAVLATGLSGVTYESVRRVTEVVTEAQYELQETIHYSFVTLRYTLLFAWIALCLYILVRFVPGGDLYIRFLRSGRNLEGNVDPRNRLLSLSATEARDVRSVLQRLREWRPRSLDEPAAVPATRTASAPPPEARRAPPSTGSRAKARARPEPPVCSPSPQPRTSGLQVELFTNARDYKKDLKFVLETVGPNDRIRIQAYHFDDPDLADSFQKCHV
ncbi:MAG: hypothetical protein EBZ36_00750, partial [Acidobacteria bacterium]|nr:hypothetical protein [Acidobacteriota bacterium]